ncbi:uncharacterized protein PRCAT00001824001 [Priceomyces carsonii]|uniref:uncharacterized protein n=1 Tax=Priceomyces carsonii TaxID=28549 RepID=UPI002EDA314B|nr:unnamed protein product [Priceomyces carsonii]
MLDLLNLPKSVLFDITQFLNQQDAINLSLTNYAFYESSIAKIYSKITIQKEPILVGSRKNRCNDYLDSTQTVIYGLKNTPSEQNQLKMMNARIRALMQSLSINTSLKDLVKEISIFGELHQIRSSIRDLLKLFAGRNLNKVFVSSYSLRQYLKLELNDIKSNTIIVDEAYDIIKSVGKPSHLILPLRENGGVKLYSDLKLQGYNIKSILVNGNNSAYWKFIDSFLRMNIRYSLTTFRLYYEHGTELKKVSSILQAININSLENLELYIGCNERNCKQDCLIDLFEVILEHNPRCLKRLSITQCVVYSDHQLNELFDFNVIDFLSDLCRTRTLKLLSIKHKLPNDCLFVDGLEGNFLRRERMYSELLSSKLSQKVFNLILPNLMMSFACYEQEMNTLLYNGCKCDHCVKHLELIDEFLFHHKYYNFKLHSFRDMTANQVIFTLSSYLSQRLVDDDLLTSFNALSFPMRKVEWNFHDNALRVPFRCLGWDVTDEGDFDAEQDLFFDAGDKILTCRFCSALDFNKNYGIVICHFLNGIVLAISDLNRGDAEDMVIGDRLTDGMSPLPFRKILINGVDYNLDKERNGTNFFTNVYDNT